MAKKSLFKSMANAAAPAAPQPQPQTRPFTQRDLDILNDQVAIMTRQNSDLMTTIARAEAINRKLIAENQQMHAELEQLKGKKK